MKTYNEMAEAVFRRRDTYVLAQQRRKRTVIRAVVPVCCACLAGVAGYGVWSRTAQQTPPPATLEDAVIPGVKDTFDERKGEIPPGGTTTATTTTATTTAPPTTTTTQTTATTSVADDLPETKKIFAFNRIIGTRAATSLYRDPTLHYEEIWDGARMTAYLGVDLCKAVRQSLNVLPADMTYVGDGTFTVTYHNDGTLVEDAAYFFFEGADGQRVTVAASRLRPPYDCLYVLETEEVTPSRMRSTGEIIPVLVATDDNGLYVGDFSYDGVYYRVTVENVSPVTIDRLLREIAE